MEAHISFRRQIILDPAQPAEGAIWVRGTSISHLVGWLHFEFHGRQYTVPSDMVESIQWPKEREPI